MVPAGQSGKNYGWRLLEGNNCFNPGTNCDPDDTTVRPIAQYPHAGGGCSVTGGYVYRGLGDSGPARHVHLRRLLPRQILGARLRERRRQQRHATSPAT